MLQDQVSHLLEELPDGASLLVAGPPLVGKTALAYRLLAAMGDRAIVVSTDDVADTVSSDYERITGEAADDSLGIVDCASRRQAGEFADTGTVKYADSPGDLTGIGVKTTELVESFGERSDDPVPVGLDSLSTLLMFWEAERVYRFLRVFAAQLDDRGWPFVATAVPTVHDEATRRILREPFDAVVEVRADDESRELRLRRSGSDAPEGDDAAGSDGTEPDVTGSDDRAGEWRPF